MNEAATADTVIEMITDAGMDYRDFKVGVAAEWISTSDVNPWQAIAEHARTHCPEGDYARAWELAGMPVPEEYLAA